MRTLHDLFAVALLSLSCTAVGCVAAEEEDANAASESDLVDPANSNIRSADIGRITNLKLLPNTNVPRATFVQNSDTKFVADLYDHIVAVNQAEGLTGADGYKQQVNLIVSGPRDRYDSLLRTIRARRGMSAGSQVPLINPIDGVSTNDIWMQDFGEFAVVKGERDPRNSWYGILDANRGRGIDVARIGSTLGITVTKVSTAAGGGTYGGNTEATAEGKLYIGDHAPAQFVNGLKALGNQDAITLPTRWLAVGHVDEYVQLVPARNRCNAAYMIASGLEALNLARKNPREYVSQGDALASGTVGAAMDSYARTRRPAGQDYVLSDFDLTRAPATTNEKFVRLNLQAEAYAVEAMGRLRAGACADELIRVPQFFKEAERGGSVALNPGTVNSLVLRSHAIVPDPNSPELRRVVAQRYAQALGSTANVHFIDDSIYHNAMGEVHCGTNTIRELAMPYRF